MPAAARWFVTLLVSFSLFAAAAWSADQPAKKKKQKAALMKQFDTNRDGHLSRIERSKMREAVAKLREKKALNRNAAALNGTL
ncbi:MAG: hypothetical protein JNM18_25285 [Planctomycetaceae bacterium]|nr:hypothetical protein [Planctomycetaceae bacterium]